MELCHLQKYRCPLFLEKKHGILSTGNSRKGIENFDRFGKSGKKPIPQKVYLSSEKFPAR